MVIGDWAIFKINDDTAISCQNLNQFLEQNCLFGPILGFKNIGKKGQAIQYKKNHANTPFNKNYQLNLEVLGAWYICNESGKLTPIDHKKKIKISMKNFIATMKMATTAGNSPENLKLSYKIPCKFSELTTLISRLILNNHSA